jgi:alkanesulfonate monooxygenase SsuD/methylene tetrahydromethanopterin reductase-like flavin-dependent oxidoreductase (luciferase family)
MARLLAIAPTRRAAEETARRGARWLVGSYAGPQHQSLTNVIGFGVAAENVRPVDPVERYLDGVVVWGTPDAVVDEIARLREEMFLDYLLCAPLSHESFVLFTDEVLPRIL